MLISNKNLYNETKGMIHCLIYLLRKSKLFLRFVWFKQKPSVPPSPKWLAFSDSVLTSLNPRGKVIKTCAPRSDQDLRTNLSKSHDSLLPPSVVDIVNNSFCEWFWLKLLDSNSLVACKAHESERTSRLDGQIVARGRKATIWKNEVL